MCGIAGYFALAPRSLAPREVLARMVEAVRHRGPDDGGSYYDGRAALGHRRLSIIDLSGGRQPLATADGNLWVTFNGEIFNYVELRDELIARRTAFRTKSDTETILHAYEHYGPDCVRSFNGDFAYALLDRRNQRLVIDGAPVIGNRVFIGAHSVIVGRITVGDDAVVCAGSVVMRPVPARAVVMGNPARVVSYEGSFEYVFYDGMDLDPARRASLEKARSLSIGQA